MALADGRRLSQPGATPAQGRLARSELGQLLYSPFNYSYVLPFEIASIVLLVAIVGAIVIGAGGLSAMVTLNSFLVLGAVIFCHRPVWRAEPAQRCRHPDEHRDHAQRRQHHAGRLRLRLHRQIRRGGRRDRLALTGQIFAIFIITVAAAEAAVALAIIIAIYRRINTIDVGQINLMRGSRRQSGSRRLARSRAYGIS